VRNGASREKRETVNSREKKNEKFFFFTFLCRRKLFGRERERENERERQNERQRERE
jgi:hypothetical protein